MPVFKTIQRKQNSIPFEANTNGTIKMQRAYNYGYIWLVLEIKYKTFKKFVKKVIGTTPNQVTTWEEDKASSSSFNYLNFANLIGNIQISGNGSYKIKNLNFSQLAWITLIYLKGRLANDIPSLGTFTTPTSGADEQLLESTQTHKMRMLMPFSAYLMAKASDTNLLSNRYETLNIDVNWQTQERVGKNIQIESANLYIDTFEKVESYTSGQEASQMAEQSIGLIQGFQSVQVSSSTSGLYTQVPPSKHYSEFFLDIVEGSLTNPALNVIKKVQFNQGNDIIFDLDFEAIKAENRLRYDFDDIMFKRIYAEAIANNQVLNPDAHCVINFSDRGHLSNSSSLANWTAPQITFDTELNGLTSANVNLAYTYLEKII